MCLSIKNLPYYTMTISEMKNRSYYTAFSWKDVYRCGKNTTHKRDLGGEKVVKSRADEKIPKKISVKKRKGEKYKQTNTYNVCQRCSCSQIKFNRSPNIASETRATATATATEHHIISHHNHPHTVIVTFTIQMKHFEILYLLYAKINRF